MHCSALIVFTKCWREKIIIAVIRYVISFIFAFVDKATVSAEDGKLSKVRTLWTEVVVKIYERRWSGAGNFNGWML